MNHLMKAISELNLLGSYIREDDSFIDFDNQYKHRLFDMPYQFETDSQIDFNMIEHSLKNALLSQLKSKRPVVMLSGGIDSTVIAHILFKNNIQFDACSYFQSEEDDAIEKVAYLEELYGIKSEKIFNNYGKLEQDYCNYFNNYKSPNLDYAFLTMFRLIEEYTKRVNNNGNLVFLDGIEGDNLFGYKNNIQLHLRSLLIHASSNFINQERIFKNRKLNIYSSSLIKHSPFNTLYQNFIFPKLLDSGSKRSVEDYINGRIPEDFREGLSFNSSNMLGMLYYMGRRVAYKNHHPIASTGNSVIYPFIDPEVLRTGFALKNKLKTKPFVKAPLKYYLLKEGYSEEFVLSPKKGMGLDLFKVISFDEVLYSIDILESEIPLKSKSKIKKYLYELFKNRDKAVDHFMFGLTMGAKYIQKYDE